MCLGAIYRARPLAYYYVCTRRHAAENGFDDDLIYKEIALPPGETIAFRALLVVGRRFAAVSRLGTINPQSRLLARQFS
jgi:tRNA(Arg) A34 adenosine deaminase TadA